MVRGRSFRIIASIVGIGLGAAACVDLFHSTDYPTLCQATPAACADEAGEPLPDAIAPDAEAPTSIDFCAWNAAEAEAHAERACAWLGACQGVVEESTFAKCMVRALAAYDCTFNPSLRPNGAARALWSCLANVASCKELNTCVFGEVPVCSNPGVSPFTTCTTPGGPTRVVCGPGTNVSPVAMESCLLEGRSCTKTDQPTEGFCTGALGLACTSAGACEGTHAVSCDAGAKIDVGIDCATFGSGRCVTDDAGITCAPLETALPCDGGSPLRCDDAGVAHRCVEGKDITIDCAHIAQKCSPTGASALEPTSACIGPEAGVRCEPDSCDMGVLRSCAQGKRFELSCRRVGLGGCTVPDGAAPFARCSVP